MRYSVCSTRCCRRSRRARRGNEVEAAALFEAYLHRSSVTVGASFYWFDHLDEDHRFAFTADDKGERHLARSRGTRFPKTMSEVAGVDYLRALDSFRVTAARTRVLSASPSIVSPSWKSIARLVFPSRLELKRPEGSFRAAPLAKVIFTTFL